MLLGQLRTKALLFTSASLAPGPTSYDTNRASAPPKQHANTTQEGMEEGTEREAHLAGLLLSLAEHERFRRREVVAEQDAVVKRATERVVRCRGNEEVRRIELCTLVQQRAK